MKRLNIEKGQRFGRLVVIKETERWIDDAGRSKRKFLCRCDCGVEKEMKLAHIRNAQVISCGCARREALDKHRAFSNRKHGLSRSRTYNIWSSMRGRCNNKNSDAYSAYGGKGIKHCQKWATFDGFLDDMGECPDGLTLDRIDGTKGYYKENCRWADWNTQANNRCNNTIINYNEKEYTLAQLARKVKMKQETLQARLRRGWSVTESVESPLKWGMHK